MTSVDIRKVAIADLSGEKVIALVSSGSRDAWVGFRTVQSAIIFKTDEGLGEEWRIRDRREPVPGASARREGQNVLRDAMLIIGSMIHDHVTPIVRRSGCANSSARTRREVAMFAATLLKEVAIINDRDFGKWRAVRGKRMRPGGETSSVWLQDVPGNILDMSPADAGGSPLQWYDAKTSEAREYVGSSMLGSSYGSLMGGAFRGEERSCGEPAAEDCRRYDRLIEHIEMFTSRSRLPLATVGAPILAAA